MEDGLAMHADQVEVGPVKAAGGEEGGSRRGVDLGHGAGCGREDGGIGGVPGMVQGGPDGLPQEGAQGVRQGLLSGRPEVGDDLAVGLQDRHIDGVQRGAGHEAQNAHDA